MDGRGRRNCIVYICSNLGWTMPQHRIRSCRRHKLIYLSRLLPAHAGHLSGSGRGSVIESSLRVWAEA